MFDNETKELFVKITETPLVITEEIEHTIIYEMSRINYDTITIDDIELLKKVIDKYTKEILTNNNLVTYIVDDNMFMDLFRVEVERGYIITTEFVKYVHNYNNTTLQRMIDIVIGTKHINTKHLYNFIMYVLKESIRKYPPTPYSEIVINTIDKYTEDDFRGKEYDTINDALKRYYFYYGMFDNIRKCINKKIIINHSDVSLLRIDRHNRKDIVDFIKEVIDFIEELIEEGHYTIDYETYLELCKNVLSWSKSKLEYRYLEHLKDSIDDRYYKMCVDRQFVFNTEFFQNVKIEHLEYACENGANSVVEKILKTGLIPNMKCIKYMYIYKYLNTIHLLEDVYVKAGNIITNEDKFECMLKTLRTKIQQITFLEQKHLFYKDYEQLVKLDYETKIRKIVPEENIIRVLYKGELPTTKITKKDVKDKLIEYLEDNKIEYKFNQNIQYASTFLLNEDLCTLTDTTKGSYIIFTNNDKFVSMLANAIFCKNK